MCVAGVYVQGTRQKDLQGLGIIGWDSSGAIHASCSFHGMG